MLLYISIVRNVQSYKCINVYFIMHSNTLENTWYVPIHDFAVYIRKLSIHSQMR